jgi:ATP-dependent exoDNAse (exonuclease V) alpha subunit
MTILDIANFFEEKLKHKFIRGKIYDDPDQDMYPGVKIKFLRTEHDVNIFEIMNGKYKGDDTYLAIDAYELRGGKIVATYME